MTLSVLLSKAGVARFQRETWFAGASLVGNILYTPDERAAPVIERCYLPVLNVHWPVSKVVVVPADGRTKGSLAFKKAYRGSSSEPGQGGLLP